MSNRRLQRTAQDRRRALARRKSFNERQRLILNKLLDGFAGKLNSSKWATIAKCSQDTALRDILDLVERGVLAKDQGGGRSTSYSLAVADAQPIVNR